MQFSSPGTSNKKKSKKNKVFYRRRERLACEADVAHDNNNNNNNNGGGGGGGGGFKIQWDKMMRKFGAGTAPSVSSLDFDTDSVADASVVHAFYRSEKERPEDDDDDEVDRVVVDREWGEEVHSSSVHSGHGDRSGASGRQQQQQHAHMASGGDADSLAVLRDDADSHCTFSPVLAYLRWRLWPTIVGFFVTEFVDRKSEEQYRKESWFLGKVCLSPEHGLHLC